MAAATCAGRHGTALPTGVLRGANVLLVTIDTLRADRVGAYGNSAGLTPTLDRLASEGIRFVHTYAHAPLTLPSHASLLTGSYPTHTGVHDNGTFQLGAMPTLATTLKAAGYRTAGFVGAFVLDARFGLHRGFDTYDDRMIGSSADLDVVQRTADQVLAPAFEWIVSTRAQPDRFFAWVHLYDPHEPYTAPEPYRSRYAADPYNGEIAYADRALGEFFDRLRAGNALTNTLIVVASDHGESLGEHGERTHGLFAYDATLRVPLVVWAPPRLHATAVSGTARLVDVAPTILDLVGAAPLDGIDGRSLRPLINGDSGGDSESYFEALNANLTRNWAPLRGVVRGDLKLIDLPQPELYDLVSDPGEQRNLYGRQRDRARPLEASLDRIVSAARATVTRPGLDPEAEARLRALGYVVSTAAKPPRTYTAADDPKHLVHLNRALDDAAAMWARGEAENAIATLRTVIRDRPDLTVAYDRLAFILRARGRAAEAVQLLDAAARHGLSDRGLLRALGSALREAGEVRRSADVLEALVHDDESDLQAADALGQTYARIGRPADAEALFKRVLARSPNASTTWNNLGSLYLSQQRSSDAMHALTQAVTINPALATAHNGLGVAYARAGQMDRAVAEWRKALELRPNFADARHNLERAIRN
jgi:arylsulfatase A-like enzyme/Flp pilus assembly protein TadD